MKRQDLRACAKEIAGDLERRPYEYWASKQYPIAFENVYRGESVQTEVDELERKDTYIHLSVSVDTGKGLSAYFPTGTSVVIRK